MTRLLPLLALGCSVASLPTAQVPPPQSTLELEMFGSPVPGQLFGYTVTGANPGETVYVVVSNGMPGADVGSCPPFLGGNCMDMTPGSSGYVVVASGAADASGVFERIAPFAGGAPTNVFQLQAITQGVDANESDVEEVVVNNQCPPDAYEPNDEVSSAFPSNGPVVDAFLCDGEEDWFSYTVGPDGFVEITVDYPTAEGDLDVELYSADGFLIDQSRRATGEEILTWYNFDTQPVDVFMRVIKFFDVANDGIPYGVEDEIIQPNFCPDDAAEDDDTSSTAQVVSSGDVIVGGSCANDPDWFVVSVVAGETLLVEVDSNGGSVELELFDGSVSPLLGGDQGREIIYTSPIDQDLYVATELVADSDAQPGADYELGFTVAVLQFCEDDANEPDNTAAEATPATPGTYSGLTACEEGNPDWFTVNLQRGDTLDLELDFSHAEADLDLYLFDHRGRFAVGSTGIGDQEQITYQATRSGAHTFYVAMYSDEGDTVLGGGAYDLTVAVAP